MSNGYSEALRNKMLRETELFLGQRLRTRRRIAEAPNAIRRANHKVQRGGDNSGRCVDQVSSMMAVSAC
jgi:hypothetical protein